MGENYPIKLIPVPFEVIQTLTSHVNAINSIFLNILLSFIDQVEIVCFRGCLYYVVRFAQHFQNKKQTINADNRENFLFYGKKYGYNLLSVQKLHQRLNMICYRKSRANNVFPWYLCPQFLKMINFEQLFYFITYIHKLF